MKRHVLLYEPRFAALVVTGAKCCTIRKLRKRLPRRGDMLDHRAWHGVAYRPGSKQQTIRKTKCAGVNAITISPHGRVWLDGLELNEKEIADVAKADGFATAPEFFFYFRAATKARLFVGSLIGWTP